MILMAEVKLQGTVIKSTGKEYRVQTSAQEKITCRLKGALRLLNIKHTNPVCVGDEVILKQSGEQWVIDTILPRRNYIIRKSINLSRQTHILASNIDLAFLVVTPSHPKTSTGFIDRFLVTAAAYHIEVVLLFNKCDRWTLDDKIEAKHLGTLYAALGYTCIDTSATTGEGIQRIVLMSESKICLFAGHSGAGKSSIINALVPGLHLKTGDVSHVHHKGKHTTTYAEMYEAENHAYLIDTPGIKELGLVDMEKAEIASYFPEFSALAKNCSFSDCQHINEPGCMVIEALNNGALNHGRYHNYLSMRNDDKRD